MKAADEAAKAQDDRFIDENIDLWIERQLGILFSMVFRYACPSCRIFLQRGPRWLSDRAIP
jgi:hypothetical protein